MDVVGVMLAVKPPAMKIVSVAAVIAMKMAMITLLLIAIQVIQRRFPGGAVVGSFLSGGLGSSVVSVVRVNAPNVPHRSRLVSRVVGVIALVGVRIAVGVAVAVAVGVVNAVAARVVVVREIRVGGVVSS